MKKYGLIGYPLGHSFSKNFFNEKFQSENINAEYINFEIPTIEDLPKVISDNPDLAGLNVTIPYKEKVISYLDKVDDVAASIGAVNVIKIGHVKGKVRLTGYNSDIIGFTRSIEPLLEPYHKKALILGTGGLADKCPDIPYDLVTPKHLLYDLLYNPNTTLFMKKGSDHGAIVKNGLEMLLLQAFASWEIWNEQ